MSSRVRTLKKPTPSDDVLPVSSEDDLLGPGDGKSKNGPKSILKSAKSKDKTDVESKDGSGTVNDASNDVIVASDKIFFSLLAQMQKKDEQIEKLSESVSCMAKEIQKLNSVILKLQEQVAKSQENTSTTSKGSLQVPFSKVEQPEGKKNGLTADKTPFSKVPRDVAKKTVKFVDVVKISLNNIYSGNKKTFLFGINAMQK